MGKLIDFNEAMRKKIEKKGINKETNDSEGYIPIIDDIDLGSLLNGFIEHALNSKHSEDSLKKYFGFDKKSNKDKKGE